MKILPFNSLVLGSLMLAPVNWVMLDFCRKPSFSTRAHGAKHSAQTCSLLHFQFCKQKPPSSNTVFEAFSPFHI